VSPTHLVFVLDYVVTGAVYTIIDNNTLASLFSWEAVGHDWTVFISNLVTQFQFPISVRGGYLHNVAPDYIYSLQNESTVVWAPLNLPPRTGQIYYVSFPYIECPNITETMYYYQSPYLWPTGTVTAHLMISMLVIGGTIVCI